MADKPHYIVDGYNAILRHMSLGEGDDALWAAREELIRKTISWRGQRRIRITVVFDGQDLRGISKRYKQAGIHILFSRAPQKADPLIMNLIHTSKQPKSITLLTSDRALGNMARGYQCQVESPARLFRQTKDGGLTAEYEQKYNTSMSKSEVAEWLDLFNNDD